MPGVHAEGYKEDEADQTGKVLKGRCRMITVMKTSTFLNAIDDAYAKGVSAGANAEAVKQREDQNRRLHEMMRIGVARGRQEERDKQGIIEISGEEFDALVDDMGDV